jgi:hypothetical protein
METVNIKRRELAPAGSRLPDRSKKKGRKKSPKAKKNNCARVAGKKEPKPSKILHLQCPNQLGSAKLSNFYIGYNYFYV